MVGFCPASFFLSRSLNTFGGAGGASSCIFTLYLQHCLLGSPARAEQEAEGCVVKARKAGNNGEPVEETEVPAHYQNHLQEQKTKNKEKHV